MTDYPRTITLDDPEVTAAKPEVLALVFDYLAARQVPGVQRVAVERMLLAQGHNPEAAKVILTKWREAGATSRQSATAEVALHRLSVR